MVHIYSVVLLKTKLIIRQVTFQAHIIRFYSPIKYLDMEVMGANMEQQTSTISSASHTPPLFWTQCRLIQKTGMKECIPW